MTVVSLDDHRGCEPLFDLRIYRHPNGDLIVGPIAAYDEWFAETPALTSAERMDAIADMAPEMAGALRLSAQNLRDEQATGED